MVIEFPKENQMYQLRQLWKLAFGDTEEFLDGFFGFGFSPDRCRCVTAGEQVAAMLFWFDCDCCGQKFAYLYGVATHPEYRNRGLCRGLMADTHAVLAKQGYTGAVLVPQQEPLRKMYTSMGYEDAGAVSMLNCVPAGEAVFLRKLDGAEFAALRRQYLPRGGVIQEGEGIAFLERTYELYAGEDFLLTAFREDGFLWGAELLGNRDAAPGILKALGCVRGRFRTPGGTMPFAMLRPLAEHVAPPTYFGLAFD